MAVPCVVSGFQGLRRLHRDFQGRIVGVAIAEQLWTEEKPMLGVPHDTCKQLEQGGISDLVIPLFFCAAGFFRWNTAISYSTKFCKL